MKCKDCNGSRVYVGLGFTQGAEPCRRCSGSGKEPTRDIFGPISVGYDEVPKAVDYEESAQRPVPCAVCGQSPEEKKGYWAFNCECGDVLSIPKKAEYVEAWNAAQEQRRQANRYRQGFGICR